MADRLPSFLPRIAALVLIVLAATAGLTFAAGSGVGSAPTVPSGAAAAPIPPLVVPDVRNQAFVFAKGTLEDAGFAWRVTGSVHGYAANVVVSQSPAAGARLVDDGTPLITLTLRRNSSYHQTGEPVDASPYEGTVPQPADLAGRPIGPAAPAGATPASTVAVATSATTTAATITAATTTPATPATATKSTKAVQTGKAAAKWPQNRPVAFVAPGANKEPLDEMPLPDRATALGAWLDSHTTKTAAAGNYWLYQNEWIITGAKLGWWRGAEALKTLIAVDRRTQSLWGIGAKSATAAKTALDEVRARAKP
jgi:beta-lactam-binding protein with PASTA domain